MREISDRVRAAVKELSPYQAGKPIESVRRELGVERIVKLASNEYPDGPFPEVLEAIERELENLNRYPDPGCFALTEAVSRFYGVSPSEVFFGNGNNEILELLVHLLVEPGQEVLYAHPSFPIYYLIAQTHFEVGRRVPLDADWVHDLGAMAEAINEKTRLVFVCNPNNPTASYVTHAQLEAFLSRVPSDVVVAVDEPYLDFVTAEDFPDWFDLRQSYPNLVSVRSFSKGYSLAGLRVGYLLGSEEIVGLLHRVRQPFNVNRLAQAAATVAIGCRERVVERRAQNQRRMRRLREGMEELGVQVLPSQTNFYLAIVPQHIEDLFDRLLHQGVIVRPMEPFGMPPRSFRVNTGTEDENEFYLAALSRVLRGEDRS
jgi:histidinol-phosphate aminotransferase